MRYPTRAGPCRLGPKRPSTRSQGRRRAQEVEFSSVKLRREGRMVLNHSIGLTRVRSRVNGSERSGSPCRRCRMASGLGRWETLQKRSHEGDRRLRPGRAAPITTRFFRLVHGPVGALDDRLDVQFAWQGASRTDAHRGLDRFAVVGDPEGRDRPAERVGQPSGCGQLRVRQDDQKLVARRSGTSGRLPETPDSWSPRQRPALGLRRDDRIDR